MDASEFELRLLLQLLCKPQLARTLLLFFSSRTQLTSKRPLGRGCSILIESKYPACSKRPCSSVLPSHPHPPSPPSAHIRVNPIVPPTSHNSTY